MKFDGDVVRSSSEGGPDPEACHEENDVVGTERVGELGMAESFSLGCIVHIVGVVC
jgi:hypothetical protein